MQKYLNKIIMQDFFQKNLKFLTLFFDFIENFNQNKSFF